ncbi:MAG: hypothetical protein GXP38_16570, partial [Chloroflexi bacterium]|nr:hypothetical protein [Chloroflexota bacterium]
DSIDQGLTPYRSTSLYHLGYALLHLGEYDRAIECGKAALPLARQTGDEEIGAQSIMLPAAVSLACGGYDKALHGFEVAARAQDSIQSGRRVLFGEDCGQVGLGAALVQVGRLDKAKHVFAVLLQQAVASHRQDRLLYALVGIAMWLARQGHAERATELYSLAASQPFVGKSRWFADAFGRFIETASTGLSTAKAMDAAARGKQHDLWEMAGELLLENGDAPLETDCPTEHEYR